MKSAPIKSIIFFLTAILFLSACDKNEDFNTNNANGIGNTDRNANLAMDDVVKLSDLINSPFEFDESSVWREIDVNRQKNENQNSSSMNDKKLIAVLRFAPEEADEIVKRAETYKAPIQTRLDAESWFPPELIAQGGNSGDETIKGETYAANDFIKPPYVNGKVTRIENTDYFILELTAF